MRVLRNRTLAPLVSARFVSLTGTNMTLVALPWFVLATTGSAAKMGIVLACQTFPAFVLGIPAGTVVARIGARRALVLGDSLRAPLLAAVPVLYWLGVLSFPLLLAARDRDRRLQRSRTRPRRARSSRRSSARTRPR